MMLNKASLDVWYELFKKDSNRFICDRILNLHKGAISDDEKDELQTLLNLEKKFIKEACEKIDGNQLIIDKLNHYRIILNQDLRLTTIFVNRVKELVKKTSVTTVEMIDNEYFKLMETDMDVKGHENLIQEYKAMSQKSIDLDDDEYLKCGNPDCLTCKEVTDRESDYAYQRLLVDGYLDDMDESAMMELMIRISRLEEELSHFIDTTCDLDIDFLDNDDIFDDDDDDDDDDY